MKKPILAVNNLSFQYSQSKTQALHEVSFVLPKKSINLLIGPNGSGKSTLLKTLLGLHAKEGVQTGKINFFDQKDKVTPQEKVQIGYVPQRFDFDPSLPLTVGEFLHLSLSNCQLHQHHRFEYIQQTLKLVKAENFISQKLGDLSGGQLQRIVLARSLLHKPSLLILDEPESGIDISGEQFFYELLKKLVEEQGLTALIASHEMEMVSQYADQVLCLNKTLVCQGDSLKVLNDTVYQQLYGEHMKPFAHHHAH